MRMSHEIFNMEWSNRDSIYLHTRDGVLYSAFAGSAERLLSLVGGLRPAGPSGVGRSFRPSTLYVQERFWSLFREAAFLLMIIT